MSETTVTVSVMRHDDARTAGHIEIDAAEWGRYAACEHPAYQWPEGLALAGDVLTDEQIEEMGLTARTTIYLEE